MLRCERCGQLVMWVTADGGHPWRGPHWEHALTVDELSTDCYLPVVSRETSQARKLAAFEALRAIDEEVDG